MTFLLFLGSLVVLEYLLSRQKAGGAPESQAIKNIAGYDDLGANETSTADLLSLGKALHAQKVEAAVKVETAARDTAIH